MSNLHRQSQNKIIGYLLAALIFAGVLVRCYEINRPIVWHDETYTLIAISGHTIKASLYEWKKRSKIKPLTLSEVKQNFQAPHGTSFRSVSLALKADQSEHPPGYFQGLYVWCRLFGTETWIQRMYSVVFGVLGLAAFYWLGLELFKSRDVALLATAMLSLSPLHIMYSVELREYGAGFFFFCIVSTCFLRALRLKRLSDWAIYAGSIASGVYFSYLLVISTVGHLLYAGIQTVGKRPGSDSIKLLLYSGLAVSLSMVAMSPLFLGLWERWEFVRQMTSWVNKKTEFMCLLNAWLFSPSFNWIFHPKFWFEGRDPSIFDPYRPALWTLFSLEIYCCYFLYKKAALQSLFLLTAFIVLAGFFWGQDIVIGGMRSTIVRYFLPIPLLAIFPVAFTIERFWTSGVLARRTMAAGSFAFLLACQITAFVNLPVERGKYRYPISKLAEFLEQEPNTVVMVDQNYESVLFVLALSHLRPRQPFAWIKVPPPDWLKQQDHVFVMHAKDNLTQKYEQYGFDVQLLDKSLSLYRMKPKDKPTD